MFAQGLSESDHPICRVRYFIFLLNKSELHCRSVSFKIVSPNMYYLQVTCTIKMQPYRLIFIFTLIIVLLWLGVEQQSLNSAVQVTMATVAQGKYLLHLLSENRKESTFGGVAGDSLIATRITAATGTPTHHSSNYNILHLLYF